MFIPVYAQIKIFDTEESSLRTITIPTVRQDLEPIPRSEVNDYGKPLTSEVLAGFVNNHFPSQAEYTIDVYDATDFEEPLPAYFNLHISYPANIDSNVIDRPFGSSTVTLSDAKDFISFSSSGAYMVIVDIIFKNHDDVSLYQLETTDGWKISDQGITYPSAKDLLSDVYGILPNEDFDSVMVKMHDALWYYRIVQLHNLNKDGIHDTAFEAEANILHFDIFSDRTIEAIVAAFLQSKQLIDDNKQLTPLGMTSLIMLAEYIKLIKK